MATRTRTISGAGIKLRDTAKDSRNSSGQVRTVNSYDSELEENSNYVLTYKRIREIVLDPTVQLARQAVVAPIIHTAWDYVETKNAPADSADYVRRNFAPLRDWFVQSAVYGSLDFGWAPFELIYEIKNGETRLKEFKQLLHELTYILVYVNSGRFAGFVNEPLISDVVDDVAIILDPYALNINLVYEGTDWYGVSVSKVLDPSCSDWDDVNTSNNRFDKKVAGATWIVYYPVGETPFNGTLTDNDTIALTLLQKLEASGGIAVPDEIQEFLDDSVEREMKGKWRIDLISAQGTMQTNFVDRMKYLDNLKMRAFGIPERAILEGKFGTKAEAETHADLALMTIDTKHRLLCDQLNMTIVKTLMRLQYGPEYEETVWIRPVPLVDAQFQTVKEVYRLLLQNQRIVEKEIENVDVASLRNQVGVPEIAGAPNDFDLEPIMTPQTFGGTGGGDGGDKKADGSEREESDEDE